MKTNRLLMFGICILLIFSYKYINAQGIAINNSGATADSSAILDVSSTSQGILFPRLDSTQINTITNPATGLQIYNVDCGNFMYNAGTPSSPNWLQVNPSPNVPPQPGSIIGSTSVLPGSTSISYSISPVAGATSYVWNVPFGTITSGAGTTSIIVDVSCNASTDILSVSAANNCGLSAARMLPITVSPVLTVSTPDTVIANTQLGGSPTASGGMGNYVYLWSPSTNLSDSTSANPTAQCSGVTTTYTLTVTDDGGCTASASTVVIRNLLADAGSDQSIAFSCTTSGSVAIGGSPTASGGQAPYSYAWEPRTYLSDYTLPNPDASPFYSTAYKVTITDNNGCTAVDSMNLDLTGGTYVTFNPTGSGRNGSYQNWTVPAGISCIRVEASGAQGGNGQSPQGSRGALMVGTFSVSPGNQFVILVGQKGSNGSGGGGGGGGTYFASGTSYGTATIQLAAGGGAGCGCVAWNGAGTTSTTAQNGDNTGSSLPPGNGGSGGNGGAAGGYSNSGGGFLTNGSGAWAGTAFRNGGTGGQAGSNGGEGGFGGGGGGNNGGGGGGGYSGGGSSGCCCDGGGGGGASYNAGTYQLNVGGVNAGDGKIVIAY